MTFKRPSFVVSALLVGAVLAIGTHSASAQTVKGIFITAGLTQPTDIESTPSQPDLLFVLEQPGRIRIIQNGVLLATPFLDITGLVNNSGNEQGLLGLAFHPDYATNGYFFVYYTAPGGSGISTLRRYQVTANPLIADPSSGLTILTLQQPFTNHNAGQLRFGPNDGYLYFGFGDGGSANDPGNRAQNTGVWFGKMLRIDIDGDDFPTDPNLNYAIPSDNPFVGGGNPLDEIWAIGLRNPWRFCFDPVTGDMYIGDVGQNAREEIDFQPASSTGGENYGWRCMEALACTGSSGCTCNAPALTLPVHEYTHVSGNCSITGGVVYRGQKIPDFCGTYFFADYCSAQIWSFKLVNGVVTNFANRTSELAPGGGRSINSITTFGTDAAGEIYIADRGGEIFKIAQGVPGPFALADFDTDGDVDTPDFSIFTQCFAGSNNPPAATCPDGVSADLDCDGDVDALDFVLFSQSYTGSL